MSRMEPMTEPAAEDKTTRPVQTHCRYASRRTEFLRTKPRSHDTGSLRYGDRAMAFSSGCIFDV